MSPDIAIRSLEAGDLPSVLDLLRTSLGEGRAPRTEGYWRWKHEQNPFGPSPALVAVADGEVIGLRAFQRWRWVRGGTAYDAVRAVDTATHPRYRGRRIFTRLTLALVERMRAEGVSFVFNTPNPKSRPGYEKMGWTSLGRMSLWVRPIRTGRLLSAPLRGRGRARPETPVPEGAAAPGRPAAEVLAEADVRRLLDRNSGPHDRLTTIPSLAYLRWRYAMVPGLGYRAVVDLKEGGGAAVIFQLRRRKALQEVTICELLLDRGAAAADTASALLTQIARESEVDLAVAMAPPRSRQVRALKKARFLPAPRVGPTLAVRPLNGDRTAMDRASWGPSIGDLELF